MAWKDKQAEVDKLAQLLAGNLLPAALPGEDQLPAGTAPRAAPGVLPLPAVWAQGAGQPPWQDTPPAWTDVKPDILTFAADIKVPEEGPIQILEVMPSHIAGSSGYRSSTHKSMVGDVIMPDLQSLFPGVGVAYKPFDTALAEFGETFGHAAVDCERAIIYPGMVEGGADVLRRSELQYAARQDDIVTVNADHNVLALLESKAVQTYLSDSDSDVARYFAPSIVLPTRYDSAMTEKIFAKVGADHDYYVIKPVDQIQGNGVRVVARAELDAFLQETLGKNRKKLPEQRGRDYWQSDINPVFVVQPLVRSKPVTAFQPVMGEYDGTLRVFMTLYRSAPDQDYQIKIHDGYWKLPNKPLEDRGKAAEKIVSSSPYRLEDAPRGLAVVLSVMTAFNALAKAGKTHVHHATAMDKATKDHVFAQLAAVMPRYVQIMQDKPLYDRVADWLHSGDEAECGTGVMMALQRDYFVNSQAAPLARNMMSFPSEFYEHLALLQQGRPQHSAVLYMQQALRDITRPIAFVARDVLHPLAENYQRDRQMDMMMRAMGALFDRD